MYIHKPDSNTLHKYNQYSLLNLSLKPFLFLTAHKIHRHPAIWTTTITKSEAIIMLKLSTLSLTNFYIIYYLFYLILLHLIDFNASISVYRTKCY